MFNKITGWCAAFHKNSLHNLRVGFQFFHLDLQICKSLNYYFLAGIFCRSCNAACKFLEPVCPLFWWLKPPKQGLFQTKQGSFGFQVVFKLRLFFGTLEPYPTPPPRKNTPIIASQGTNWPLADAVSGR